jgi:hypothetical protein
MDDRNDIGAPSAEEDPRRVFLRDATVFHGKLLLDGLRDVILFPVALVTAVIDLIRRDNPPGRHFYDVVHFGKQTEQWIDLFEAVNRAPETDRPRATIDGPSLDDLLNDLEGKLRSGEEKGEISASLMRAMEQLREAAKQAINDSQRRS